MHNYNYILLLLAEVSGPKVYYAVIVIPILGVAVCVLVILGMLLGKDKYKRRKYVPVQGDNQGPGPGGR